MTSLVQVVLAIAEQTVEAVNGSWTTSRGDGINAVAALRPVVTAKAAMWKRRATDKDIAAAHAYAATEGYSVFTFPAGKPNPKPVPHQITKDAKTKQKKLDDKAFRDLIWKLDEGKSRATGKPLVKSGTTDWHKLGEVDHAIPRSLAPELIYESSNGVLLSKWENRMRKVSCVRAPEHKYFDYAGPENRREPQHFVWRNDDGQIIKETRR